MSQGIGSRSSSREGEKVSLTLSPVLGMKDACMYHYDRHDSDAVHEMMISGTDFAEHLGDWRKIMSIGFAALRPIIRELQPYQSEARLYMMNMVF